MSGSVHVQNLQTTRIQVDSVNNVSVQDICYKSKPTTIEGLKSFSELKATNLKSGSINGVIFLHLGDFEFFKLTFRSIRD